MDTPRVLHHYTDGNGLLGIFQQRELWMTHIQYLNDSQEFEFVSERAVEGLETALRRAQIPEQYFPSRPFRDRHELMSLAGEGAREIFVASFTDNGDDDLSQWRAYSKSGSRYSIAFSKEGIERLKVRWGLQLEEVTYGDEQTRERILGAYKEPMEVASYAFARAQEQAATSPDGGREAFANASYGLHMSIPRFYRDALRTLGPWCKHGKFRAEKEWRLATDAAAAWQLNLRFRPSASFVVPFRTLPLADADSNLPIESVTVGPTAHMALAVDSIKRLLLGIPGAGHVEVKRSDIPYRDW